VVNDRANRRVRCQSTYGNRKKPAGSTDHRPARDFFSQCGNPAIEQGLFRNTLRMLRICNARASLLPQSCNVPVMNVDKSSVPRRKLYRIALSGSAAIFAALILSLIAWVYAIHILRARLAEFCDHLPAPIAQADHGAIRASGWPLMARLRIDAPRLKGRWQDGTTIVWGARFVNLELSPWSPGRLLLSTSGRQAVIGTAGAQTAPEPRGLEAAIGGLGPIEIDGPDVRVAMPWHSTGASAIRLRLTAPDLTVRRPGSTPMVSVKQLVITAGIAARGHAMTVGITADAVRPLPAISITDVEAHASVAGVGGAPPTLALQFLSARWNDSHMALAGTVRECCGGRATGDGTLTLSGLHAGLSALGTSNILPPNVSALVQQAAGYGVTPRLPDQVQLPVSVRQSQVFVGALPLGPMIEAWQMERARGHSAP